MSIKEVAKTAGVSIATVSRYLNNPELLKSDTRKKVKTTIEALNFRPNTLAQNFRRGKSRLIMIAVHDVGNPLYENFTRIIGTIAQSKGYDTIIKETSYHRVSMKYYCDLINSKQADGLIIATEMPNITTSTASTLQNLPIIIIKRGYSSTHCPSQYILIDDQQGAMIATQHLIEYGHRHIACITQQTIAHFDRLQGFINTMQSHKLDSSKVCQIQEIEQLLQQHNNISAIFCTDDDIAIDTLSTLKQKGITIPQDISVIGFNNIRYASKTVPALTTIEQPFANVAQYAVELLCHKIEGNTLTPSKNVKSFYPLLVPRHSVAPPKQLTTSAST